MSADTNQLLQVMRDFASVIGTLLGIIVGWYLNKRSIVEQAEKERKSKLEEEARRIARDHIDDIYSPLWERSYKLEKKIKIALSGERRDPTSLEVVSEVDPALNELSTFLENLSHSGKLTILMHARVSKSLENVDLCLTLARNADNADIKTYCETLKKLSTYLSELRQTIRDVSGYATLL